MRFSAKAEYACQAMRSLASRPRGAPPARIREIAEAESIPETYLVQILQRLKGAGLVRSIRGSAGGYCLARPAREINVAEVLDAIDGADADRMPSSTSSDPLVRLWRSAQEAALDVLRATSIEDLLPVETGDWVI